MTSRVRNVAAAGALSAAAAAVGGLATDPQSAWYRSLELPPWQPPAVAFPLVWTGLYASIAGASGQAVTAYEQQGRRDEAKVTWRALVANLVLNRQLVGPVPPGRPRRPPRGPSPPAICRVVHLRDDPHRGDLAP